MNDDKGRSERIFLAQLSILSFVCSMGVFPRLGRCPLRIKGRTTIAVDRCSIGARGPGSHRSTRHDLQAESVPLWLQSDWPSMVDPTFFFRFDAARSFRRPLEGPTQLLVDSVTCNP
jgi:hypothetical protein